MLCGILVVECAFSPSDTSVMQKLDHYTKELPALMLVAKLLIREKKYSSPSNKELNMSYVTKNVQCPNQWFPPCNDNNEFGPVIIDNVAWINIEGVEIHVWVRQSKAPINVYYTGPDGYAKEVAFLFNLVSYFVLL